MRTSRVKKKKTKTKAIGQRIHAKRRLYQRYGFEVNKNDYKAMCAMIQEGEGFNLKKLTNRVSLHLIQFNDEWLFPVYDHNLRQIATFLTLEMGQVKEVYAECHIPLEIEAETR